MNADKHGFFFGLFKYFKLIKAHSAGFHLCPPGYTRRLLSLSIFNIYKTFDHEAPRSQLPPYFDEVEMGRAGEGLITVNKLPSKHNSNLPARGKIKKQYVPVAQWIER